VLAASKRLINVVLATILDCYYCVVYGKRNNDESVEVMLLVHSGS